MTVNGTLINYFFNCKRQCYLHGNRLNLEDNSEIVKIGKAMHEEKEEMINESEIAIDSIKLDGLTTRYLIEIKKSDANVEACKWQLLFYLKILKDKGVMREGKLEFVEKNKQAKNIIYVKLTEENQRQLEKYIEENNLKAGDRLPSQAEMCERLGVSRTSVREVLKMLEARNVIEIINGKGAFLKGNVELAISARIELKKEREDILEIFEVRKMLEREIIKLVIERATEEELDEVEEALKSLMYKYENDIESSFEDRTFHMKLYRICHNKLMLQLIESLMEVFNKIWKNPLGLEKVYTSTIPYHKKVFDYIRQRNIRKAQATNDKMLDIIIKKLLQAVRKL